MSAIGYPRQPVIQPQSQIVYRLGAVNPDHDLTGIIQGLKKQGEGRLCLYGPPGTGKTEFATYLARQLDRPLLLKRGSDLLGPYVGETEANIAAMFHEARYEDAVLLLDEADSFLRDRSEARRSWEVTQVNELLTQMERFNGVFVCSTNLMDSLDTASLRRFDLKVKFDFLQPLQAWDLFRSIFKEQGVKLSRHKHWQGKLKKYSLLTPGDFATVVRKSRISGRELSPESLLEGLAGEVAFKQTASGRQIGFLAP
jgi:SpoVK/Ycf46/Vps4 family AAA+-type ATPase